MHGMLAEMVLTLGDYGVLGTMVAVVGGAMWHRTEKLDDRLAAVESEKADRREVEKRFRDVERGKVDKHAWVRETMRTRDALDKLNAQGSTIEAKIDASHGLAPAINSLAGVLRENKAERNGE